MHRLSKQYKPQKDLRRLPLPPFPVYISLYLHILRPYSINLEPSQEKGNLFFFFFLSDTEAF